MRTSSSRAGSNTKSPSSSSSVSDMSVGKRRSRSAMCFFFFVRAECYALKKLAFDNEYTNATEHRVYLVEWHAPQDRASLVLDLNNASPDLRQCHAPWSIEYWVFEHPLLHVECQHARTKTQKASSAGQSSIHQRLFSFFFASIINHISNNKKPDLILDTSQNTVDTNPKKLAAQTLHYRKTKQKIRRGKRHTIFPFYFLLHKRAKPILRPHTSAPSLRVYMVLLLL